MYKKPLVYQNRKTLLCKNILSGDRKCKYIEKCAFAHSLKEQKLVPIRKTAYDIINGNQDLSNIDLTKNRELFKTLEQLTKVCQICNVGNCTGGYNCRNGAIDILHQVCYNDLVFGNCIKKDCECVHLTKRGLKPNIKVQCFNVLKKKEKEEEKNKFYLEISDDDSDIEKSIFDYVKKN